MLIHAWMYVCMCVCIYIYIYIYVYIFIYMYIYIYTCIYIYIHVHAYMYIYMYIYIYMYARIYVYVCIYRNVLVVRGNQQLMITVRQVSCMILAAPAAMNPARKDRKVYMHIYTQLQICMYVCK
jgi:hypothetical protein